MYTPVLYSLHWLPVKFRIQFKTLVFVFNAVNGLAPPYINETLRLHQSSRALRSAGQHLLEVPRSRSKQWGDRSFAVAGPKFWNALPSDLRTITDLPQFKAKLKTYLFKRAFHWSYGSPFCCCLVLYVIYFKSISVIVKHFGQSMVVVRCYINKCWLIDWLIDWLIYSIS